MKRPSIRGGAGYYYRRSNGVAFEDVVGVPPFAPIVNITNTNFTNPYSAAGVANPFPASFGPINPGASVTFPQNIAFTQIFDRHFRLPQILTYNLTVEHEFRSSWLLRAEYAGNRGAHLGGTGDQEAGLLQLNPSVYIPGEVDGGRLSSRVSFSLTTGSSVRSTPELQAIKNPARLN